MKHNKEESWKKILSEAEGESLDVGSQKTLKMLLKHAHQIQAEHQAPISYESELLEKLKAKLPVPQQLKQRSYNKGGASPGLLSDFFAFLRTPQLSWGLSGAMAVFVAVFLYSQKNLSVNPAQVAQNQNDLLSETATRGGEEVANDWLASVGDVGIRSKSGRSLSSLVEELESNHDAKAVDQALDKVAAEMGMKNL